MFELSSLNSEWLLDFWKPYKFRMKESHPSPTGFAEYFSEHDLRFICAKIVAKNAENNNNNDSESMINGAKL